MKTASELAIEYWNKSPIERVNNTLQDYVFDYKQAEIDELQKHKEILLGEVYLMGDAIQYHRILNLLKGNTNED